MTDIPRAFVACRLPDAAALRLGERIDGVRRDLGDVLRWEPHERLHATLRFLGRVAGADRAALTAALTPIARSTAPIACRFDAAIALPSWRRAQVVALALESGGALEALARVIDDGLRDPFGARDKAFRAHVTLARVGRTRRALPMRVQEPCAALALDLEAFSFAELSLFRSDSTRDGPRYTAVERFPFLAV
jgi:2'-5' RNA ligase